jgi:phosphatidylserine/phosphatidylglycerophosphate/cardiolipin synthase-like enzyme
VKHFLVVLLAFGLAASASALQPAPPQLPATGTIEAAFTPGDEADRLIIEAIGRAKRQVLVQAYTFTHRRIASALIRAHRRGVDVEVIADAQQANLVPSSVIPSLAEAGVPVLLDAGHDAAHNKVMVIDPGTPDVEVITGSFNFTHAAQTMNAENVLLIRANTGLADRYTENWWRHREHSTPYLR